MWHLGTWFIGGLGNAGVRIGFDDLLGIFQPKKFYDFPDFVVLNFKGWLHPYCVGRSTSTVASFALPAQPCLLLEHQNWCLSFINTN